jgi:polysaccharide pyruvyl transferase WcaK-like protein
MLPDVPALTILHSIVARLTHRRAESMKLANPAQSSEGPARSASPGAKRIGLFGIFGTGNFGNDGSLEAMVISLRRSVPAEPLLGICTGPEGVTRALGIEAVPIYYQPKEAEGSRVLRLAKKAAGRSVMWLHALRQIRRLKAIMVPGMGALDDFGVSPFGWPLDLMTWFLLARLMGVKVILANVGAGPIHHPLSRLFFKAAARAAHYRSFRDRISHDYMAGLGVDVSRDPVVPDIAFALPAPASTSTGAAPLTIGVGVMTYYGWHKGPERVRGTYDGYIAKMTAYVAWLMEKGHRVRLLIGDETDNLAAGDILNALRAKDAGRVEASVAFAPASGLHDVMAQMAEIDVAAVTRFHNVVCALKMGKPTISIGYQDKNDVLQAEMGLADFCQHIERLDLDRLKDQTERLIAGRQDLERRIRDVRARFMQELGEQEGVIAALVGGAAR